MHVDRDYHLVKVKFRFKYRLVLEYISGFSSRIEELSRIQYLSLIKRRAERALGQVSTISQDKLSHHRD